MKIFSNPIIKNNIQKQNFKKINNFSLLSKDTVSFSGKVDINYEMKNLPKSAFLSDGLREFMLQNLEKDPNIDICEIHREYYSPLLDCQTLDEAKKLFPEFQGAVDAKNIDLSKKPQNNILCCISRGENRKFTLENVTLNLMKEYYAQLIPLNVDYLKDNLDMSRSAFSTLLSALNISMDTRYLRLINLKLKSESMREVWQTTDIRERMSNSIRKTFSTPEHKQKASLISKKRWLNPEFRKKVTQIITLRAQSSENRQRVSNFMKQQWQNEEFQKLMKINSTASILAWSKHPYAKNAYKEIVHEFPELKAAFEAQKNKIPLTQRQEKIINLYHKRCIERYPNLKKEVVMLQKELLQEWGYYDEDRDIDKIFEYIKSLGF